jgi:hypothetical protein
MTYNNGHMTSISGLLKESGTMLEIILGSVNSERVLIYLLTRNEGYAREIARFFKTNLSSIQKQLAKLETGGILISRSVGRTLVYSFNPAYPFLPEVKKLLEKGLSFYPQEDREELTMNRRRPRRHNKPL